MWDVGKLVEKGHTDGGRTRVPGLTVGRQTINDNVGKDYIFRDAFFPPPPTTANVPTTSPYPPPAWTFEPPTDRLITSAIRRMKNGKATRPGTIPNDLFKATADLIVPYLGPIYRATFTMQIYPPDWSNTETIVLKKPARTDYRLPGAWRPIVLSNGHGRLLNSCMADEIVKQAELLGLLPAMQFG
ncbi:hypothetical protein F5051DRAFT_320960, partial [Lentinula edodes]